MVLKLMCDLTLSQQAFLGSTNQKGGRGTLHPLAKTLLAFS